MRLHFNFKTFAIASIDYVFIRTYGHRKANILKSLNRNEEALKSDYENNEKVLNSCDIFIKKVNPKHPAIASAWYTMACIIYSLKNDKENALINLSKAIELDTKYKEDAKKDEAFKNFWDDEDFKRIVR